jgi:hypothetical protein
VIRLRMLRIYLIDEMETIPSFVRGGILPAPRRLPVLRCFHRVRGRWLPVSLPLLRPTLEVYKTKPVDSREAWKRCPTSGSRGPPSGRRHRVRLEYQMKGGKPKAALESSWQAPSFRRDDILFD